MSHLVFSGAVDLDMVSSAVLMGPLGVVTTLPGWPVACARVRRSADPSVYRGG
jgi:hypothetical protein